MTKPKSTGVSAQDLAFMTAIGIGAHNFGEGLAIGQSYASGATALGASVRPLTNSARRTSAMTTTSRGVICSIATPNTSGP